MEREKNDFHPSYWPWGKSEFTNSLFEGYQTWLNRGPANLAYGGLGDRNGYIDMPQPGGQAREAMRTRLLMAAFGVDYLGEKPIPIRPPESPYSGD